MREFFTESNGRLSSMRLQSFIMIFLAVAFVMVSLVKGTAVANDTLIIILTAGFCPKVIQKFAERDAK